MDSGSFLSLHNIFYLLEHYRYTLIFPISVIEGPIISIITGFLVSLKILNIFVAYVILVVGDIVGDVLHFWMGKYWGKTTFMKRWGKYIGYNENSEQFLEKLFKEHTAKAFVLAKMSHGIGGAVQVAAGIANVDIWEFIWYNFLGTIPKTAILLLIGYYAGSSYVKISSYLNSIAFITIGIVVVLIAGYFVLVKYADRFFRNKSDDSDN
jgi:membrane protein DedA with SNARE-associated domain